MNLKKLGLPVLCCGAVFMTNCGNVDTGYKTVAYDEAKTWVTRNFGEGKDEREFILPKNASVDYSFGGYLTGAKYSLQTVTYFKNHIGNFLKGYTYLSPEIVDSTLSKQSQNDEAAWKTPKVYTTEEGAITEANFYPLLNGKQFDYIIGDWFYGGFSKYAADYVYNPHNKSFKVIGTYNYSYYDAQNKGTHLLKMPSCTIEFNPNGTMKCIEFYFTNSTFCSYYWDTGTQSTSDGFSWNMYQGSYISITFNY